jgi:hypothetical protein
LTSLRRQTPDANDIATGSIELRRRLEKQAKRQTTISHAWFLTKVGKPQAAGRADRVVKTDQPDCHQRSHGLVTPKSSAGSMRATSSVKHEPEAVEMLENDEFEGNPAGWQHHETIADFTKRAPVGVPSTAALGMYHLQLPEATHSLTSYHRSMALGWGGESQIGLAEAASKDRH